MAIVEKDYPFLSKEDFSNANPLTVSIVRVYEVKEGARNDARLLLRLPDSRLRCMSYWGDNKNVLIDKFGNDNDAWTGRTMQILQTQKIGSDSLIRSFQ